MIIRILFPLWLAGAIALSIGTAIGLKQNDAKPPTTKVEQADKR